VQVATRIPKARKALALGASFSGFHSGARAYKPILHNTLHRVQHSSTLLARVFASL
jgi:hypothetical protein